MSCDNITEIINNINDNCLHESTIEIEENCPIVCLTSMLFMYNHCLQFLAQNTDLKNQLKYIIEWCYYKKNIVNYHNYL